MDPHTYPGRPWPISALTIRYTDLYMRKSFRQIQANLAPDSVLFLGDLFDGGREWSAGASDNENQDKRWRGYDTKFWLKEYRRFSNIFFDPWLRGRTSDERVRQRGRKLIAGLPGNHDLGLGNGIRIPVRKRFQAYFGSGNRIDVLGNHTFISLDTVSLSAKNQLDPSTGNEGTLEGKNNSREIWEPVEHFLHSAKTEKARMVARDLRLLHGYTENDLQDHDVLEFDDPRAHTVPVEPISTGDMPSVVLSHVPLYRDSGTPCGPFRERFPPSRHGPDGAGSVEGDDANSIHLQAGFQYQNVLTPAVSSEIVDLVGDVSYIFSGDDHDYCDVLHQDYGSGDGGIREITVKSVSWAMGVRKPGFLLLSLWNPVDQNGSSIGVKNETIQVKLCLLPDQLSIFISYGWLLATTLLALFLRAVWIAYGLGSSSSRVNGDVLSRAMSPTHQDKEQATTSASTGSRSRQNSLTVRSSAVRPRSISPFLDDISLWGTDKTAYEPKNWTARKGVWNIITLDEDPMHTKNGRLHRVWGEFRIGITQVAFFVIMYYVWLLWNS